MVDKNYHLIADHQVSTINYKLLTLNYLTGSH